MTNTPNQSQRVAVATKKESAPSEAVPQFAERSRDYNLGYEVGLNGKPYDKQRDGVIQWWEYNQGYRDGWQDSMELRAKYGPSGKPEAAQS